MYTSDAPVLQGTHTMKKDLATGAYTYQEEPLKVVSARLSFWHIRKAKKIGKGSFTQGIRNAIEHYIKQVG